MKNKKADIPMLKTIIILLLTLIIFISFVIILLQAPKISIDEKKIKTQLVVTKLFNAKCFSDEYATIEENKFTQDNVKACFNNIETDITFKLSIKDINDKEFYSDSKEVFMQNVNFCSVSKSNILCTRLIYPITYLNANNEYSTEFLILEIITR